MKHVAADINDRLRFDHFGMTTLDLIGTVEQYRESFGFELIRGPIRFGPDSPGSSIHRGIFGGSWTGCQIAYMISGEGVGLEVFQFCASANRWRAAAACRGDNIIESADWLDYRKPGVFHVAFSCNDVGGAVRRLERTGGTRRSEIHQTGLCSLVYCEDAAGLVVELIDRPFADLHARRDHDF